MSAIHAHGHPMPCNAMTYPSRLRVPQPTDPPRTHWSSAPSLTCRNDSRGEVWVLLGFAPGCCILRSGRFREKRQIGAMGGVGRVRSCLLVLAFVVVLGYGAQAVQFEVSARTTKCIAEEIQNHVVVVGDYKIVHSDEAHKVTVKVTSPYGNQLHYQENVQSGQFAFTTSESGNFMACFWMLNAPPTATLNVALDWKTGVAAKDWASIAKKDKLDGMELELRKLEEAVGSIHSEMLYLREREAEMRDLNELTNSRVAWFGIMSLLVCLGVAGWQLWHLKTFFERKKLL